MESKIILVCLALVLINVALTSAADKSDAEKRAERRVKYERWRREHCTNCTVKGKEYQGHSRFRYDEGCNRFRCTCRCDGSWECPAERTINMCERREAARRRWRNRARTGSRNEASRTSAAEAGSSRREARTTTTKPSENGRTENRSSSSSRSSSSNNNNGNRSRRQYRRCRNCVTFGESYKGNSYFSAVVGCTNYTRCICKCDGSWNCPAGFAKNICTDQDSSAESATQNSCKSCSVKGKTFEGGRNFRLTDGCLEYENCICRCDGSWNCPGSQVRDKCKERKANSNSTRISGHTGSCRECVAKGKTFAPNSLFDLKDKCMEYSNCECYCNGSWVCPPSHARNVCRDDGDERRGACQECSVYGENFEGNKSFTISQGCWEYRNCFCDCNGSWDCPGSSRQYVCDNEGRRRTSQETDSARTTTTTSPGRASRCRTCHVYGKNFRNQNFNITDGCINYRRCICRCDGSWECKGEHATNICDARQTEKPTSSTPKEECSVCHARNMEVQGSSNFTLREGCWENRNCICHCNGTWECARRSTVNICTTDTEQSRRDECVSCNAKGKVVPGGTVFNMTDGCYRYTSCKCGCDGSWKCPSENGRNICPEADNRRDSSGCMMCKTTDGTLRRSNQPFTFIDDCIERNCDCFCNGSWSCPGNRSRWICTDRCRGCEVEGEQVRSNTQFKHKTGCLEYTCNCHCNGSWSCPGETVKNTCPVGVRNNCNKCQISASEEYPGESDFVLKQGCLHYKCRCNCDGSYSCPAEDSRNVCYGERLGGCRSCVVAENEIYKGGSDFDLRRGCIASECRCYCNGTWQCPVEKQRNTCLGEVLGGCKVCQVDGNKTFRGNSEFDFRKDCLHYKCKCNCDGTWDCPGEHTRNVCKGEMLGGCRSCVISDDKFYPGNSNFDMMKNCIHYKCRCKCDGSYNCPGEKARRVCVEGPNGKEAVTQRPRSRQGQCRRCYVSEKEQFEGDSEFSLTEGCHKYMCSCKCDGSWDCPAERTINICSSRSEESRRRRVDAVTHRPRQTRCRRCRVKGQEYEGNTTFSYENDCFRYRCSCNCDGSWDCPPERTEDICRMRRTDRRIDQDVVTQKPGRPQSCRRCRVSQREQFKGNTSFSLTRGCDQFMCSCKCDGSWECPAERTVDICSRSVRKTVTERPRQTQCRQCRVSDRQQFEGNKEFSLEQGCYKFRCFCRCNGSWDCPLENVTNTCNVDSSDATSGGSSTSSNSQKQHCKVCRRDGEEYTAGSDYKITRGCQQYQCTCNCNGSSQCDLNNPTYICSGRRRRPGQTDTRWTTRVKSGRSPDENYGREGGCRSCDVIDQQVSTGQNFSLQLGCVLYKKCKCRCDGQWQCADKERINRCEERNGPARVIYSFEGTTSSSASSPSSSRGYVNRQNQRGRGRSKEIQSSAWVRVNGDDSSFVTIKDKDKTGGGYKIEVKTKYAPTFKYGDGRRVGQLQENKTSRVFTASGSKPSRGRVLQHERSSESSGRGISRCNKCIVDTKRYPTGAHFDMRRGCVVYKCLCLCSGSYRCRLTSDNACTEEKQQATCRNCLYQGMIFPGNMGFTVRDGCLERQCSCHCNGTHNCSISKPLPGCSAESAAGRPSQGSFYPVQSFVPTGGVGYVRRTGSSRVYTSCPSCGLGKPPVYHTPVRRVYETGDAATGEGTARESEEGSCGGCEVEGEYRPGGETFTFQKDCVEFDCYCSCGGNWKCSGRPQPGCRPSRQTDVASDSDDQFTSHLEPARLVSGSDVVRHWDATRTTRNGYHTDQRRAHGSSAVVQPDARQGEKSKRQESLESVHVPGCRDCFVEGKLVGTLSTFVRKLGCMETVCRCDCGGNHDCPSSASVNVCELNDTKPMGERKGCKAGNKTYLTRVFPLVENCIQRTCICHDDGRYTCKRNHDDIQVC